MDEIWSIIGLSSLIASVVTVTLGIVRDVLIERYRFKRQSEAGYLQSQIRLYSQIHFLLKRLTIGAVTPLLFEEVRDAIKKFNEIIEKSSDLLTSEFLGKWLDVMTLIEKAIKAFGDHDNELTIKLAWEADKNMKQLIPIIKETMNNKLIPKYRKIVGKTVPTLE